ncbi:MAG: SDR family oxidoreductase [Bacteroidales bacterium]|nr:SDR family oxidoreductase [Bacteroidales bacterium]
MNIVITGASKGIGREVLTKLAGSRENKVVAIARSGQVLHTIESESEYGNIYSIEGDINDLTADKVHLTEKIKSYIGHVDILINNAGALIAKPFDELTADEERVMVETNFISPMRLIRILLPMMKRGSHIVNIGSMGGFQGSSKFKGLSVYSAAKAAISVLTETLATEYSDSGISFNCLAFGSVQTEMLEEAFPGYRAPIDASGMAGFVIWFSLNGHKYFNGKILPVSVANP